MKLVETRIQVIDDQTVFELTVKHDPNGWTREWHAVDRSTGTRVCLSGPVCGTLEELFSDAVPAGGLRI